MTLLIVSLIVTLCSSSAASGQCNLSFAAESLSAGTSCGGKAFKVRCGPNKSLSGYAPGSIDSVESNRNAGTMYDAVIFWSRLGDDNYHSTTTSSYEYATDVFV